MTGLLFSTVVMLSIAGISLWSFLLLMQAYMVVPGSFGGERTESLDERTKLIFSDMGGALYGKYMRTSILISITVSQIGFVCGKLYGSLCMGTADDQPIPSLSLRTSKHSYWPSRTARPSSQQNT